jgi:hypothetical protein
MATLSSIADELAAYRDSLQRQFDDRVLELKERFGNRVVSKAMTLAREQAEQRERISITAQRQRRRDETAAARQVEKHFRTKERDEPTSLDTLALLPPGWR